VARRSIICAVDDSEWVCPVVHTAERLADQLDAELELVHVTHLEVPTRRSARVSYEQLEARALESGRRLLRWAVSECRTGPVRCRVEVGDPAHVLAQRSHEAGVELLVVGTRGRGHLKAAILGSVSAELATRAGCPVLVVPPAVRRYRATDARSAAVGAAAPLSSGTASRVMLDGMDSLMPSRPSREERG